MAFDKQKALKKDHFKGYCYGRWLENKD